MTPCSWVRSFSWDALWLQSALWLAPLALLLASGQEDPSQGPLDLMVFGFTALFWIAHRFSSTWLAYATTAYRPLPRADPVRFAVIPITIMATCFGVLLPGDDDLPYTRAERVARRAGAALRTSVFVPALLAFGFASGFLHYWLDRAVYRMSDPAAARPAMTGSSRGPAPARRLFHKLSP